MTVLVRTCNTCDATPCVNPRFCEACRQADARLVAKRQFVADTFISIGDAAALALANLTKAH